MIASRATRSKPFSRKSREAVSTIRSRFSAAFSRLTRICASLLPLDRIYDDYHVTRNHDDRHVLALDEGVTTMGRLADKNILITGVRPMTISPIGSGVSNRS